MQKGEPNLLFVAHEPIPGYMEQPMTMGFTVAGSENLDRLRQGDPIRADLEVAQGRSTLRNIVVLEKTDPAGPPPSAKPFRQPQPGDVVPNFVLQNQDGKLVRLRDYRGKALLVTFIYTRCPLPEYCPRMNDNFVEIEKALRKESSAFASTHLLSISFDPEFDSPEVLRRYGMAYLSKTGASTFDHWEFVVTPKKDLAQVAEFFGLTLLEEEDQIVHSMSTAVISRESEIYVWHRGNGWQPEEVLRELLAAAQRKPATRVVR